jgi:inositol transport system ATP-binding protein
MSEPLLRMTGITKSFPGVMALGGVELTVAPAEIHALLGENGAGKSTLLKILAGAQPPDGGTITFAGAPATFSSPHAAQVSGIVTIYQEFTLAPNMSICENVFIGREPGSKLFVSWRRMAEETRVLTRRLGLEADPMTLVRDLSVAEQQLVEIARALSMKSRLIVMDEPTSALSQAEVEKLFRIIRDLKADGISVIFVTHRLEEVIAICDGYTVLRDGKYVGSGRVADTDTDGIIRMMVGREVNALFHHREDATAGEVALSVEGISRRGSSKDPSATVLADVSFSVRRGEILGIAGLVGAGRTEVARLLGADRSIGAQAVDGKPVGSHRRRRRSATASARPRGPQAAGPLPVADPMNMSMAALDQISRWGSCQRARRDAMVEKYRQALSIRMAGPEQIVANLSGGNQQKVVLARWLALQPKVLIVDEPTRGIDIGAKVDVHNLLFDMARSGIAVIAISSELPEVLAVSDRIVTMREGRVTGEIARADATQERLMAMMTLAKAA